MRKNVLKYDDVLNKQRTVIYAQRRQVLEGEDLSEQVNNWIDEVVEAKVHEYTLGDIPEEWDLDQLVEQMHTLMETEITADELREDYGVPSREQLVEDFTVDARERYAEKEQEFGETLDGDQPLMRDLERFVILQVVDTRWREHLESMDYLREGVHLRAMAQKDPLVEYTSEGHRMFEELTGAIREEVVFTLFHAQLAPEDVSELQGLQEQQAALDGGLAYEHESLAGADAIAAAGGLESTLTMGGTGVATAGGVAAAATSVATGQRVVSDRDKLGRNDPCWCGSGKKYKKCHGQ
jgi:preprotein translocase subunit SecA